MGVFTYHDEVTSAIPPAKLFKALVLEVDTIIPKVVPHAIKSSEIIEGHGGPGTIRKITFAEGSQFKYMKHKVEAIDKEKFTYSYSVIEGDTLMEKFVKITYEMEFVASPDGGSILKSTSKYHAKGEIEIKEEEVKVGKEKALGLFRAVEAYISANPDA